MRPLCLVLLLAGCGGSNTGACPPKDGVLLLSWTVQGLSASEDEGCRGVDHLELSLTTVCEVVTIEPIPCTSGARWRYDRLPTGPAEVQLDAFDTDHHLRARGWATVSLTSSVPAAPQSVDLRPPKEALPQSSGPRL